MRVWLYYRLSRDDDEELNSLTNQRKILADYAESNGHEIVGESFDDNVTGMTLDRDGIEKIYDAVSEKLIDAVIVKDLSRLGRHRTHTALFMDYLKANDVRVLSATENIDSFNENDDLIIGVKGILNDYYSKDIARKIKHGYHQKQKSGGIVTIPPMGYYKDKNTGEIIVKEEPAEIVRQIFKWYAEGYGLRAIALMLNEKGVKSASYYQKLYNNKNQGYNKPKITFDYLWEGSGVKRILQNEFYTGILVCHKEDVSKINKKRKKIPKDKQYRYENYAPAIISKELFEQVQFLLEDKPNRNVRAGENKPFHRYTGLLKCKDCGCVFVAKKRIQKNSPIKIEYVCNGYHRYGKEHCTSHRIDEPTLDRIINDELVKIKVQAQENWQSIESDVKKWASQKSNIEKKVLELNFRIKTFETDIENILMERINDKENRATYDSMIEKRRSEISDCKSQLENIRNIDETIKKRKSQIKQSIDLIDEIIADGGISNIHLRMLVDEIRLAEDEDGLDIIIILKAPFARHMETYNKDGEVVENDIDLLADKFELIAGKYLYVDVI